MHAVFIPYGKIEELEIFFRDMRAQKHYLRMYKKDEEDMLVPIEGALRLAPFGVYEYVFPKEDADKVLTTLKFAEQDYDGKIGKIRRWVLRNLISCDKIPEFKQDKRYLWITENVGIIPIGVRYDGEIEEPEFMQYSGWRHEAL